MSKTKNVCAWVKYIAQEIARSALGRKKIHIRKNVYLSILISSAAPLLEFSGTCSIRRTVSKKVTFTLLRTLMTKQNEIIQAFKLLNNNFYDQI